MSDSERQTEDEESGDESISEKVVTRSKRLRKTPLKELKKPQTRKVNTSDPFNVAEKSVEILKYVILGKKDCITYNKDGQIGFAKYYVKKSNDNPTYFFQFNLEPDAKSHLTEGVSILLKQITKLKK